MKWSFRQIEMNDSEKVFNWRNSPEVYRYMFHSGPVALEDHQRWMKKVISDKSVLFLMASYDGHDVGTVRFDFKDDFSEAEVGIYLAPEFHGKGLGTEMLLETEKIAKERVGTLKKIVARVVPENAFSEKMFSKTGYQKKFIQLEKILES